MYSCLLCSLYEFKNAEGVLVAACGATQSSFPHACLPPEAYQMGD